MRDSERNILFDIISSFKFGTTIMENSGVRTVYISPDMSFYKSFVRLYLRQYGANVYLHPKKFKLYYLNIFSKEGHYITTVNSVSPLTLYYNAMNHVNVPNLRKILIPD